MGRLAEARGLLVENTLEDQITRQVNKILRQNTLPAAALKAEVRRVVIEVLAKADLDIQDMPTVDALLELEITCPDGRTIEVTVDNDD